MTTSLRWAWPLAIGYLVACGGRTKYEDEFAEDGDGGPGVAGNSVTPAGGRAALGGRRGVAGSWIAGGIAQGAAGAAPYSGWPGYSGKAPQLRGGAGYGGRRPAVGGRYYSGGYSPGGRANGGAIPAYGGRRRTGGTGGGWRPTGGTGYYSGRPSYDAGVPVGAQPAVDGGPLVNCSSCLASYCGQIINACVTTPVCYSGILCSVASCPSSDLGCALGCFGGDIGAAVTGLNLANCVVTQCGSSCLSMLPIPIQ